MDQEINIHDFSKILGNVKEIFSDDKYIEYFKDILQDVFKNKFIDYLPKKDVVELKMNLQYDKEGLINLINKNEFIETKNNIFKEVFFNRNLNDEEIIKKLNDINNNNLT